MKKISLKTFKLQAGSHKSPSDGLCVTEAVASFNRELHSHNPECACPVLTSYLMKLNDNMTDLERQRLKPYIKKVGGTRDGNSVKRFEILVKAAVCEITPYALRLASNSNLIQHAEKLENLKSNFTYAVAYDAVDAAYVACAARPARNAAAYAAYVTRDATRPDRPAAEAARDSADAFYTTNKKQRKVYFDIALKALNEALEIGKTK